MNIQQEILNINSRLDSLAKSIIQIQKNQTPITAKAESAESGVKAITPTTLTKTAYIDDTQVIFTDVPSGNMTIFTGEHDIAYTFKRDGGKVLITFPKPITEVTEITLSII